MMKYGSIIFIPIFLVTTSAYAIVNNRKSSSTVQDSNDLVKTLGWVTDCQQGNLCCGHYFEPNDLVNNPSPKPLQDIPMNVSASEPVFFTQQGASVLKGNVVLSQPGREITADHVTFFRDSKTEKISSGLLYGHVNFREYGKFIVAEQGNLDFVNKVYSFNNGIYRLLANTPTGLANVWGRAKRAISDQIGILRLAKATYTTCPPNATTWYLRGTKINLDQNIGRGEITNGILFYKKIPVFYFPYYHFPLDNRRYSGFLMPTFSYSSKDLYRVGLPYYFNLAPNYDALFTPEYYHRRGVLLGGMFRYLTPKSTGSANLYYIPHDREFVNFRDSATINNPTYIRSLEALKDSNDNRGLISYQHRANFSEQWHGALDVNYASDDYFLEDFSDALSYNMFGNDQLFNQAIVGYSGYNWNFFGRVQMFQTLHRITCPGAQDQYKKLPQIGFSGDFPGGWGGLDYKLDGEIVNFAHRDNFYQPESTSIVKGARFSIAPGISAPLNVASGYVIPKVQLRATGYQLHDRPINSGPNNIVRLYPLISVDSGIIFSRYLNVFRKMYTQTLEPRLFYLYVPQVKQDTIPIFDTYRTSFGFNQLFRTNRFSGIDRVGDANQFALAFVSKFLNEYGQERFNVGLGQIFSLHKHKVDLDTYSYDPLQKYNLSPLVGNLQFVINTNINTSLDAAWDHKLKRLSNMTAGVNFTASPNRYLNLAYVYDIDADQVKDKKVDCRRINVSLGWKVWQHWNIIGNLYYNASLHRPENYFYGLEYDACCWALRVVRSRNFIGIGADDKTRYDSLYTVQLVLKGVGSYLSNFKSQQGVGRYIDDFLSVGDEYK